MSTTDNIFFMTHTLENLSFVDVNATGGGIKVQMIADTSAYDAALSPRGFYLTNDCFLHFYENDRAFHPDVTAQIRKDIARLEKATNTVFGGRENPLILAVRPSVRTAIPGLQKTVLNVGWNEEILASMSDPLWAWESYTLFLLDWLDMFAVPSAKVDDVLFSAAQERATAGGSDVEWQRKLVGRLKALYKETIGRDVPSDPFAQLDAVVKAALRSWDNPRGNVYRKDNNIPYAQGVAVIVQQMVFGNKDDNSAVGEFSSRDPETGNSGWRGVYVKRMLSVGTRSTGTPIAELAREFPAAYDALKAYVAHAEARDGVMRTVKFVIESGKLFIVSDTFTPVHTAVMMQTLLNMAEDGTVRKDRIGDYLSPDFLEFISVTEPELRGVIDRIKAYIGNGAQTAPQQVSTPPVTVAQPKPPEQIQKTDVAARTTALATPPRVQTPVQPPVQTTADTDDEGNAPENFNPFDVGF